MGCLHILLTYGLEVHFQIIDVIGHLLSLFLFLEHLSIVYELRDSSQDLPDRRIEVILDVVVTAARDQPRNISPLISKELMSKDEDFSFLVRKDVFHDFWV